MKNKYRLGLKGWEKKLALLIKAGDIDCPVCDSNDCRQWEGVKPSHEAMKDCPLVDRPELCKALASIIRKISDNQWTLQEIVSQLRVLHLQKEGST